MPRLEIPWPGLDEPLKLLAVIVGGMLAIEAVARQVRIYRENRTPVQYVGTTFLQQEGII
jgi:hypothetical protein